MVRLEIYILGNLKIYWDGKSITEKLSNKALGLLCFLAVNKGKKFSRDKLAAYFWDGSNIDSARYNLRYNLWTLRKIINKDEQGEDILISDKDTCMVSGKASVYIDVFEMNDLLETIEERDLNSYINELERIKQLYAGEFLEEFYLKRCIEFNDWIFYEREKFQRNYIDVLHKLTYLYKTNAQYDKAIHLLEEMLLFNPLKEELYVELINIYIKLGDRDAALSQYERCCTVLREELNVSPMESTKKIYDKIKKCSGSFNKFEILEKKSTDWQIHRNVHVLFNHMEDFNKKKKVLSTQKNKITITNNCYPLENIGYYWISNLVEKIFISYGNQELQKLEFYYWQDILRIQAKVLSINKNLIVKDLLSMQSEKIRVFNALEHLLNLLATIRPMVVCVEDFHHIDKPSFEFLKYFFFKNQHGPLEFILCGEEKNSKMQELKKYMGMKSSQL
ncbi:BTAD domain-containing putative transcriptional regulator [Clostridiaceae bacterium 35-E11]